MKRLLFLFVLLCPALVGIAQDSIETAHYKVEFSPTGTIRSFVSKNGAQPDSVQFRSDRYAGFAFDGVTLKRLPGIENVYEAKKDGIKYKISYKDHQGTLMVEASVRNESNGIFIPEEGVKLYLGLDSYMDRFPHWNHIYFPTMIRCERTHMTSYFAAPDGKIVSVVSPDPVASWCHEYESSNGIINGHKVKFGGHRIYTSSYYLLHRLPLPCRHPQNLFSLAPGKEKKVRFFVQSVLKKEEIPDIFNRQSEAPVLSADLYTLPEGETFSGTLLAAGLNLLEIRTPRNEVDSLTLAKVDGHSYKWSYTPFSGVGEYTVTARNKSGKISEMKLYVRPDFDYYLIHARKEALRSKPTTTSNAECFLPLYTYFLARKYTPSPTEDRRAEAVFDSIFPVLFDKEKGEMRMGKSRIQNAAMMAGALADRYQTSGDEKDLRNASALVDFVLTTQKEDGGYYRGNTYYTSVIYIAKSIMEVMNEEKKLTAVSKDWRKRYERHKKSVTMALDDLVRRGDNIQTEGQMTFEDGMISCSATQLALGALKTQDARKRKRYMQQAIELNKKHWCLTQSLIPDARMNGATLRFWEYQYTINLIHNAMNSPCGWSAWKYYGSWYLYLLTGEYNYMREAVNGLGSALQLLDAGTGELRFGFVPDPYIDAFQFTETPKGSRIPQLNRVIVGEQYLSQISSWHYADFSAWRKNVFGIDNFVHEVFKCMCEIFMENAYVMETESGELKGINCVLSRESVDRVKVKYLNPRIKNLHINLKKSYTLEVDGKEYTASGLKWLIGFPNDLEKF